MILILIFSFTTCSALTLKKPKIVTPKNLRSGFIEDIEIINSTNPILIQKWSKYGTEYQEFGYLQKKYSSYFLDQSFGPDIAVPSTQILPVKLPFEMGKATEKTGTWSITGSAEGSGKISKLITGKLAISSSYSESVTNSEYWRTGAEYQATRYGVWRVAGFFVYETQEFKCYTVKWNNRQKKFIPYRYNYTVIIHKPIGYVIYPQFVRYLK